MGPNSYPRWLGPYWNTINMNHILIILDRYTYIHTFIAFAFALHCICICICIRIYMYMYMHIYIYNYIYIYMTITLQLHYNYIKITFKLHSIALQPEKGWNESQRLLFDSRGGAWNSTSSIWHGSNMKRPNINNCYRVIIFHSLNGPF